MRITAIAACILLAAAGVTYFALHRFQGQKQPLEEAATSVTLDLRPYSENRGAGSDSGKALGPLHLPTQRIHLTLQLPVGADEGLYTMHITNDLQQVVVEKQVSASLQNHIVTGISDLDLRQLPPGHYQLALRTGQDGWHTYPLLLGQV